MRTRSSSSRHTRALHMHWTGHRRAADWALPSSYWSVRHGALITYQIREHSSIPVLTAQPSLTFSVELMLPHYQPLFPAEQSVVPFDTRWERFVDQCRAIASLGAACIVFPCKQPYFAEQLGTRGGEGLDNSSNFGKGTPHSSAHKASVTLSITQRAVDLVQRECGTPVMLTICATIPNTVSSQERYATPDGVQHVLEDFIQLRGGRMLLVVRGDDKHELSATGPSPRPFISGADMLHFAYQHVAQLGIDNDVTLAVAGYPQGPYLRRQWDCDAHISCEGGHRAGAAFSIESPPGYALSQPFLCAIDRLLASPRMCTGCCSDPLSLLRLKLQRTFERVHAACQLSASPSHYSPAEERAHVEHLVNDKIMKGGARLVVSQMVTTATEFIRFAQLIQAGLRRDAGKVGQRISEVEIVPGVLVPPLPLGAAESYAVALLYTKVIPSALVTAALQDFMNALHAIMEQARVANTPDAVERLQRAKELEDERFHRICVADTVNILRTLQAHGHHTVHFFTYRGDAAKGVRHLLHELPVPQGGTSSLRDLPC